MRRDNARPISRFTELRPAVEAAEGSAVTLRVWREGVGETDFVLVPRQKDLPTADGFEKRCLIGVTGGEGYLRPATRTPGPFEALALGARQTWDVVWGSLTGIWAMITGQIGRCNLSGAISIAEVAGDDPEPEYVAFNDAGEIVLAGVVDPPGADEVRDLSDRILGGVFDGDLAVALEQGMVSPSDGGARSQEDQRVEERQLERVDHLEARGRPGGGDRGGEPRVLRAGVVGHEVHDEHHARGVQSLQ